MLDRQIILEIGCGEKKVFPSSITLDIHKTSVITLLGDAKKLPIKNESVDYIYSSHTIEHFSHSEVGQVLREWTRVLRSGGEIEIRCPDLRARALFFSLHPSKKDIINIYGGQDYPENLHRCGFSYGILRTLLNELGIVRVRRIYDGYKGIPFIPSDLHVIGTKK